MIATKNRTIKTTNGTTPTTSAIGVVDETTEAVGTPQPTFDVIAEDGKNFLLIKCSLDPKKGHVSKSSGKTHILCQASKFMGTGYTLNGKQVHVNLHVMVPVA